MTERHQIARNPHKYLPEPLPHSQVNPLLYFLRLLPNRLFPANYPNVSTVKITKAISCQAEKGTCAQSARGQAG